MANSLEQLLTDLKRGKDVLTKKNPPHIWHNGGWVAVTPEHEVPEDDTFDRLSRPEPNDVQDRLAYVNMLMQTGSISPNEAEEARRRILSGL